MAVRSTRRLFVHLALFGLSLGLIHGVALLLTDGKVVRFLWPESGQQQQPSSGVRAGPPPSERPSSVTESPAVAAAAAAATTAPPVSFHRRWDANCSAILAGDKGAVQRTKLATSAERKAGNGSLPVPPDAQVRAWTRDCAAYRRARRYPVRPASEEEAGFPVAYSIVIHRDSAQVERLLRAIYQPQNLYCLHPDAKAPADFREAVRGLAGCFENVFVASKVEMVQYAGFTRLLADINCMRDLVGPRGSVRPWRYVLNLCGQDFPLKTNLEIVRQLRAYGGMNDITGVVPPPYIRSRTLYVFAQASQRNGSVHRTGRKKKPPPGGLEIRFGNAYIAASRPFVDFVLGDRRAVDLLAWSNDTYSPDEHYWATLHRALGTPGGYPNSSWDENVRFMKWGDIKTHPYCTGKYMRALCIFDVAYLEYLVRQPHLFANKFHYDYDPVALQCLEEELERRTLHPGESDKLRNFPVTNLVWQKSAAAPRDGGVERMREEKRGV